MYNTDTVHSVLSGALEIRQLHNILALIHCLKEVQQ